MKNIGLMLLLYSIPVIAASLYIRYCGKQIGKGVTAIRKEHAEIIKNGQQYVGEVTKVINVNSKDTNTETQTFTKLEVTYYNSKGQEVTFTTPYVTFHPEQDDFITCKIAEYKDKKLAYDFMGYTEKTIFDSIKSYINMFISISSYICSILFINNINNLGIS